MRTVTLLLSGCTSLVFLASPLEGFRNTGLAASLGVLAGTIAANGTGGRTREPSASLPPTLRTELSLLVAVVLLLLVFALGRGIESFQFHVDKLELIGEHTGAAKASVAAAESVGFSEVAHLKVTDGDGFTIAGVPTHATGLSERREVASRLVSGYAELGMQAEPVGAFTTYTVMVTEVVYSSAVLVAGALATGTVLPMCFLGVWGVRRGVDVVGTAAAVLCIAISGMACCAGALSALGPTIGIGGIWSLFLTASFSGIASGAVVVSALSDDSGRASEAERGILQSGLVLSAGLLIFAASPWRAVSDAAIAVAAGIVGVAATASFLHRAFFQNESPKRPSVYQVCAIGLLSMVAIAGYLSSWVGIKSDEFLATTIVLGAAGVWQIAVSGRVSRPKAPLLLVSGLAAISGSGLLGEIGLPVLAAAVVWWVSKERCAFESAWCWAFVACVVWVHVTQFTFATTQTGLVRAGVVVGTLLILCLRVRAWTTPESPRALGGPHLLIALSISALTAAVSGFDSDEKLAHLAIAAPGIGLGLAGLSEVWKERSSSIDIVTAFVGTCLATTVSLSLLSSALPEVLQLHSDWVLVSVPLFGLAAWSLFRVELQPVWERSALAEKMFVAGSSSLSEVHELVALAERECQEIVGIAISIHVVDDAFTVPVEANTTRPTIEVRCGRMSAVASVDLSRKVTRSERVAVRRVVKRCLKVIRDKRVIEAKIRSRLSIDSGDLGTRHDVRKALIVAESYLNRVDDHSTPLVGAKRAIEAGIRRIELGARGEALTIPSLSICRFEEEIRALLGEDEDVPVAIEVSEDIETESVPEPIVWTVLNLVDNSLAARPRDVVQVKVARSGEELVISVSDDGFGIEPSYVSKISQLFFTTKGRRGGLGVGIPEAHATAARCGGKLEIESSSGVGTRVEIRLPLQSPHISRL
jgi:signal transduction histidine kinase